MPGAPQVDTRVGGEGRCRATHLLRQAGLRLNDVEVGRHGQGALEIEGAAAELVRQREEDPVDFLGLLLLERDDLVVDLDGAERLEEQTRSAGRAAVHDARDRAAMLGPHDQDITPVAIGDDLFLQVPRRVLGAQVRLEGRPQATALLPEAFPDGFQLGARVVGHRAGGLDGAADVHDLALERPDSLDQVVQVGKRAGRGTPDRLARLLDRGQQIGEADELDALQGPPLDRQGPKDHIDIARGPQGQRAIFCEKPHRFGRGVERRLDLGRIGGRADLCQLRPAEGCERELAEDLEDPRELEGPEGAWLHSWTGKASGCPGQLPQPASWQGKPIS